MIKITSFIYRSLRSSLFFYLTASFLALSALWITLSAGYPLPFDEYYHFGIIKVYAHQWLPFITQQPPEASLYGDITRYTSYLYHYLMSFPLRVIAIVSQNETTQIIILRLINIALTVGGLFVFRRVLLRAKLSKPLVHVVLAMVALTPIVSLLAAQINYDNLLFLLVPLTILFAQKTIQSDQVDAKNIVLLISVGLLACLVKYPYAPIFVALIGFVAIVLIKRHGQKIIKRFPDSFRIQTTPAKIALILLAMLAVGLAAERYGVNLARYGDPIPPCEQVQSFEVCKHYTPWWRNYNYQQQLREHPPLSSVFSFTGTWFNKMIEGFFIPFSHLPDGTRTLADPFGPIVTKSVLPVQYTTGWVVLFGGGLLTVFFIRRLWQNVMLRLFMVVSVVYVGTLWLNNFSSYLALGEPLAIQARYLLLVVPLVFACIAQAAAYALKRRSFKTILATIGLLVYINGAGVAPFIIRSDPGWYWKSQTAIDVNQAAKKIVSPFVIK